MRTLAKLLACACSVSFLLTVTGCPRKAAETTGAQTGTTAPDPAKMPPAARQAMENARRRGGQDLPDSAKTQRR